MVEARMRNKTLVSFEDDAGWYFAKQLLSKSVLKSITRVDFWAEASVVSREEGVDKKHVTNGDRSSTLSLPGGAHPAVLVWRLLCDMLDADPFWTNTYTKQFAITRSCAGKRPSSKNEVWIKTWYKEQKPHWGRCCEKVFSALVAAHPEWATWEEEF
jgi:hypothetical protein